MGKRLTIALAVFAFWAMLAGTYTAGYFSLPTITHWSSKGAGYRNTLPQFLPKDIVTIERQYPQQWMTTAFGPAAKLEGWLRGVDVQAVWRDPELPEIQFTGVR